jgi:hypothetical protein
MHARDCRHIAPYRCRLLTCLRAILDERPDRLRIRRQIRLSTSSHRRVGISPRRPSARAAYWPSMRPAPSTAIRATLPTGLQAPVSVRSALVLIRSSAGSFSLHTRSPRVGSDCPEVAESGSVAACDVASSERDAFGQNPFNSAVF